MSLTPASVEQQLTFLVLTDWHVNEALGELVGTSFLTTSSGAPLTVPKGLVRSDGKRPDGVTQIPRSEGKCASWDVTVTDTLPACKKLQKYVEIMNRYTFVPI